MFLTFALLTFAIIALWFEGEDAPRWRRHAWAGLWGAAIAAALFHEIVRPIGLLWLALLAAAARVFFRAGAPRPLRVFAGVALLLLTGGLMTHALPGFANPLAVATRFGADAVPYRLFFNFDKASAGLLLLAALRPRLRAPRGWRTLLVRTAPAAALTIALVLVLSLAARYVRFDLKWPRETWLWLWANLFFTCTAEEALFRGVVQAQLASAWRNVRYGPELALALGAILFGLAHAAGGVTYVGLATLAGAGYGWAFLRTQRIEASILTHFALNTLHFLAFTYPALTR